MRYPEEIRVVIMKCNEKKKRKMEQRETKEKKEIEENRRIRGDKSFSDGNDITTKKLFKNELMTLNLHSYVSNSNCLFCRFHSNITFAFREFI